MAKEHRFHIPPRCKQCGMAGAHRVGCPAVTKNQPKEKK